MLFTLFCGVAPAVPVHLAWDDAQTDVHWVLEQRDSHKADGEWRAVQTILPPARRAQVDVTPGKYTWRVRAATVINPGTPEAELLTSDPSNEVTATIRPDAPANLRITLSIEGSKDLRHWEPVAFVDVPATERRQFYRPAFKP